MMGEDNLNLLYQMTPYLRYKNFLLSKQNNKCKECGKDLSSLKATLYALHHDPRLGDKGAKYVDFSCSTRNRIVCNECHGKHRDTPNTPSNHEILEAKTQVTPIKSPRASIFEGTVEAKLRSLGYQNTKGNLWIKGNLQVHLEQTKNCGRDSNILIYWRESWENDHAIVFDYSCVKGPVCIVSIKVLFTSEFVSNKRSEGYGDSLNWWSQKFPLNHDLAQLVLRYENRWDLL
jgi:hypothetical protein